MALDHDDMPTMRRAEFPTSRPTSGTIPITGEDDIGSEVDEPPDHRVPLSGIVPDFHRSIVLLRGAPKESLLTKALQTSPSDATKPEIHTSTEMSRRRSTLSNTT